ncbi:hypothetical protein [[Eubacterium] cellulosolvens]
MKFRGVEYVGFFLILVIVIILFSITIYSLNWGFALIIAVFSGMLGFFLIPFGFWGADFAFGVAYGHVDQSNERGHINGLKNFVYVPFIKNYTPLEWWNISWFIVVIGLILSTLSTFVLGYSLAKILNS